MRWIAIVAVLGACGSDDGGPQGAAEIHVDHYDYTFDLATRAAHARVEYTFTTAGNCVTLPDRASAIDATTLAVDGAPAGGDTSYDAGTSTLVMCGPGHAAGDTGSLEVDATVPFATLGGSQVGYSTTKDQSTAKNPFTYMVSWVNGCDQFGPCDNRPDQFATYTFHVAHDPALEVRCSGAVTDNPDNTLTDCDFALPGGPTYSTFGFAAYPRTAWAQSDRGVWGSTHVTLYDRADTGIAAAIRDSYHAGFVSWMESTFGPYPYGGEFRLLVAPTYWAGFEHPGNIVIDDHEAHPIGSPYANELAHTLDHEMAHQWAGDQTTLADTYDFVWKESMAEYLAFVWEDTNDHAVGLQTARAWKTDSAGTMYFPVPDDHPALFDYYGEVYGPGPLVLFRQLEVLAGRDKVIAALQTLLGQPRALSVAEVVDALARSTGLDLTAYKAAWIESAGVPVTPAIAATYDAATHEVHITQTTATDRRCKFHVGLEGATPADEVLVEVDTFHGGIDQTISVATPPVSVTSVKVDPDAECLVTAASP